MATAEVTTYSRPAPLPWLMRLRILCGWSHRTAVELEKCGARVGRVAVRVYLRPPWWAVYLWRADVVELRPFRFGRRLG